MKSGKTYKSFAAGGAQHERVKVIAFGLAVLLMIGMLASCGSSKFEIEGKWKSVGSYGFGQAQPGNIVSFDGTHCNFYSPADTYALRNEDGNYYLDVTGLLADSMTFSVEVVNKDNIKLSYGGSTTELQRVS